MKNPPSFQFYPQDFLSDINVQSMTMTERGIFFRKICQAVENGDLEYLKQFFFIGKVRIPSNLYRKHMPAWIKKAVLSIGHCLLCGNADELSVDHIIPVARGGGDDPTNLQCLCRRCNSRKGAKT